MSGAKIEVQTVTSKKELLDMIKDSDMSLLDYQFGASIFTLGVMTASTSKTAEVYFFRHGETYDLVDVLKDEIKSILPNAVFINQGALKTREDDPNFIQQRPIYSAEQAHAEVKKILAAKQVNVAAKTSVEPLQAPGIFGFFNGFKKKPAHAVSANKPQTGPVSEDYRGVKKESF